MVQFTPQKMDTAIGKIEKEIKLMQEYITTLINGVVTWNEKVE